MQLAEVVIDSPATWISSGDTAMSRAGILPSVGRVARRALHLIGTGAEEEHPRRVEESG